MPQEGRSADVPDPDADPAALLVQHLPGLEAFLRLRMGALLRRREGAEDLVQSVCREVLDSLPRLEFRGAAPFRNWVFGVAANKLRERQRQVTAQARDPRREVALADLCASKLLDRYRGLCTPSREVSSQEAVAHIEQAFDDLPADWQEAISLHRLAGLDYAEIAAQMRRSEGAVRNLVYRGLARFALRLQELDQTRP
jgi:RNA polymerase sigma factor (sigma-70 family)